MLPGSQWIFTSATSLQGREAVEGPAETRPCDPEGGPRNWLSLHSTGVASSCLGGCPRPRLQEWLGRWVGNLAQIFLFWVGRGGSSHIGSPAPNLLPWGQRNCPHLLVPLAFPLLPRLDQAQGGATFWGKGSWRAALAMPSCTPGAVAPLSTQHAHMRPATLCIGHQQQTQSTHST